MTIDFQQLRFEFPSTTGRSQNATLAAVFSSNVLRADTAINSFNIGFTRQDHHLFRAEVHCDALIQANTVHVTVTFALRDSSGFFDDPYEGYVFVLVLVERE